MEETESFTHNGSQRDISALRWRHPVEDIEPEQDLEAVAEAYIRRLLFWLTDGGDIVQVGQRALALTYALDPSVIGGATLDEIGKKSTVTRQGIDKYVSDFRDTFPGIRSRVMRDDSTRQACRSAQLNRQ